MQNSERSSSGGYAHLVSYRSPEDTAHGDEDSRMFWMACGLVAAFIAIAVAFVAATNLGGPV